ncbi:hypothetical protein FN846DRAFT_893883 [Sphaerosporella brunnea]|uniref:Uncharacterized protein n=1 Tax=Sphaerosporella brunnea TaxID=1250544 RepID=A0A5J5EKX5_9PEZI|nr:hypothetical protein FN846DRAFT_893883 [Sphaerosporella brunnea]
MVLAGRLLILLLLLLLLLLSLSCTLPQSSASSSASIEPHGKCRTSIRITASTRPNSGSSRTQSSSIRYEDLSATVGWVVKLVLESKKILGKFNLVVSPLPAAAALANGQKETPQPAATLRFGAPPPLPPAVSGLQRCFRSCSSNNVSRLDKNLVDIRRGVVTIAGMLGLNVNEWNLGGAQGKVAAR